MKRSIATLVAAGVLSAGLGTGIASAQTAPATTPSSTTVAQAPAKKDPPKAPFLVLHITPMATYEVGGADLPRPPSVCSGGTCGPTGNYEYSDPATNLGYGANLNFAPKWSINYVHSYINQNIGAVTNYKGETTYQLFNNDRTDDANIAYNLHGVSIAAGWHERVRQCCYGDYTPEGAAGETSYHYWYLQGSKRFGPGSKYFGQLIGLTLQAAEEPHVPSAAYYANPACRAYATAAQCATPPYEIPGEGNKFHGLYNINATLPIGGADSKFAVFGTYLNNWDYFDSAPVMYLYNEADYGIIEKFSPFVTLTVNNSNLYEHHEGYPYINPNVINRNKLIMTLDFAIPVL